MGMPSLSSIGEGCQNESSQQAHGTHSSPGVAGTARMKERWRNVGGPVRSWCSPGKERYKGGSPKFFLRPYRESGRS